MLNTLNMKGVNTPVKKQRLSDWKRKHLTKYITEGKINKLKKKNEKYMPYKQ